MAKIIEEKVTFVLSYLTSSNSVGGNRPPVLSDEQKNQLRDVIESLVNDNSVIVEVE